MAKIKSISALVFESKRVDTAAPSDHISPMHFQAFFDRLTTHGLG
jgi:hypothetical protein